MVHFGTLDGRRTDHSARGGTRRPAATSRVSGHVTGRCCHRFGVQRRRLGQEKKSCRSSPPGSGSSATAWKAVVRRDGISCAQLRQTQRLLVNQQKKGRENSGKTEIDREFEREVCWRGSYLSFSSYLLFRWNGLGQKTNFSLLLPR